MINMSRIKLSDQEEFLAAHIVNVAYIVHKELGPGLLEKIYEISMAHVLQKEGIKVIRQADLPVKFQEITFNEGLRMDLNEEDCVICEIKAVDVVNPVWQSQILSHLKLSGHHVGFLINFNVPLLKNGIRRYTK